MWRRRLDPDPPPGRAHVTHDRRAMDAATLRETLLAFYDRARRDLPWRRTDDPYAVWVSEVMLQQTRVDTVVPYYQRWMERFPDVSALARADEDDVLGMWKGLGYYSRARNLHRAAQIVREEYHGRLPEDPGALKALPGVGDYTAGAIASIAFRRAEPVVDGNVRRVLSRLLDMEAPSPSELRTRAAELVDPGRPGDFNQALMELGARVCTPGAPDCGSCSWQSTCLALARGTVSLRPAPRARGPVPIRRFRVAVVALASGEGIRLLLRKRPGSGLLAGMWEFPAEEVAVGEEDGGGGADPRSLLGAAVPELEEFWGVAMPLGPGSARELGTFPHAFSHFRAEYRAFLVMLEGSPRWGGLAAPYRWVTPAEADSMPLPVAQQAILARAVESPLHP